jgi:hypothetical protein
MARTLYTVENLVDEVRSVLDEENTDSVDTSRDILPALNRAQDFAFDVYARIYPEPILKYQTLQLVGGQQEYDIPEDAFEDRIVKIEITIPSGQGRATYREIDRIAYTDISEYESSSVTNVPYYYCIISRKIRFIATPSGTYNARLWYLRSPEKLVLPQGRITVVNNTSNYVVVDSIGDSITTEIDQLGSFVNLIDGQTGVVKGTMQVMSLNENKVTFRTVPTRNTVINREVSGSLESLSVELDDYITTVDGTCVPYFGRPTTNFIIQYGVADMTRKMGGAAGQEEEILKKFEQQVERTWAGRAQQLRVSKKSQVWGVPTRRWFWE